ncbi:atp-dependent clp protease adaptor protein [Cystoisospora suis]|uniref:Atp-dependent clp protease adaptor protein n=1 Tax=Cystoisospora suis TaxID=483139 RepID=A0A2C6LFU1_9APIC|nr:atp-dependent clp protease adaptor protein [Cystoisospora suis]
MKMAMRCLVLRLRLLYTQSNLLFFLQSYFLFHFNLGLSLAVRALSPPNHIPPLKVLSPSSAYLPHGTRSPALLYVDLPSPSSSPDHSAGSVCPSSYEHLFSPNQYCRPGEENIRRKLAVTFQFPLVFSTTPAKVHPLQSSSSPLIVSPTCFPARQSKRAVARLHACHSIRGELANRLLTHNSPVSIHASCTRGCFTSALSSPRPPASIFSRGFSRKDRMVQGYYYRQGEEGREGEGQILFGGNLGMDDADTTSDDVGGDGAQRERMQDTTIEFAERRKDEKRITEEEAVDDEAKQEKRRRRLQAWQLVLHNDDVHAIPHVTELLVEAVPTLTKAKAHAITVHAHKTGLALIMKTWREKAKEVHRKLKASGLTVSMIPSKKQEDKGTEGGEGDQGNERGGGGRGGGTDEDSNDEGNSDDDDENNEGDDDNNTGGGEGTDSDE